MSNYIIQSPEALAEETKQRLEAIEAQSEQQRQADRAATQAVMDSIRAEAAERGQQMEAEAEQQRQAEAMRQQEAFRTQALSVFIAAGGIEDEFETEWPTIRAALLRQRTIEALQPTHVDPVSNFIAQANERIRLKE